MLELGNEPASVRRPAPLPASVGPVTTSDLTSWESTLRALTVEYVQGSGGRLDDAQALLAGLREHPNDASKLRLLKRAFHAFAGSGGTYGFTRVSSLGLEGEQGCLDVLAAGLPVPPGQLARWGSIIEDLRREFSLAATTSPTPVREPGR